MHVPHRVEVVRPGGPDLDRGAIGQQGVHGGLDVRAHVASPVSATADDAELTPYCGPSAAGLPGPGGHRGKGSTGGAARRPAQRGRVAGQLGQELVGALQAGPVEGLVVVGQVAVGPGVVRHLVTRVRGPRYGARVGLRPHPDLEERGLGVVPPQDPEHLRRPLPRRAVIEGEGDEPGGRCGAERDRRGCIAFSSEECMNPSRSRSGPGVPAEARKACPDPAWSTKVPAWSRVRPRSRTGSRRGSGGTGRPRAAAAVRPAGPPSARAPRARCNRRARSRPRPARR